FEDATAQELLSIHAQKDMKTKVLNNQFNNIQHDREKVIGNDQRLSVGRDDTIVVERDRHTSIKGGLHLDVKSHREEFSHANYHSETAGDYSRLTEGKETIFTGKENSTQAKRIILKGNEKIDIQGPMGSVTIDETGIMLDAPVIKLRGKVEILTPVINSLTGGNGGGRDFNNAVIQASAFSVADDDKSLNSPSPDDSSEGSSGEKSEGEEDDNKYKVRFLLENDENKPYVATDYIAIFPEGSQVTGKTNSQGYTGIFNTDKPENIHIDAVLDNSQSEIK
ncbi:bacteriophage T4 gp5 trimerisation domain-containing protein, partial [Rahnella woolbedingensis]